MPAGVTGSYTYADISARLGLSLWTMPEIGEIWLHEWLHGVSYFYDGGRSAIPAGGPDGGGRHNYSNGGSDPSNPGWSRYYRDLMTQNVSDLSPDLTPLENYPSDERTGIGAQAWRCGTVRGGIRKQVFVDYFYRDNTANYQKTGTVSWNNKAIRLGSPGASSNNEMYSTAGINGNFTVTGHVQIPASGVGIYDSVAVGLKDEAKQVKYWASLVYGTQLGQRNNMSILRNDRWGALSPIVLSAGWYTIKVQVDYAASTIRMKAWPESQNEPSQWQSSTPLDAGASISHVGFRHYGQSVVVDDLVAESDAGTFVSCRPLTITDSATSNGLIVSAPFSIYCGKNGNARSCRSEFAINTSVTLTATPNVGFSLSGWTGDCSSFGTSSTCAVDLSRIRYVGAVFAQQATTYPLAVTFPSNGYVTSSDGRINCGNTNAACNGDFAVNGQVALTAVANQTMATKLAAGQAAWSASAIPAQ